MRERRRNSASTWRGSQAADIKRNPGHHADPVSVREASVSGIKGEATETVEDGLAFVDLDRERIVRSVAEDDIRAGIDGAMGDLLHVVEDVFVQAPVERGDHDV